MATILTTSQRSNNLPGSETSSEPELEPLPFDPRAVLPVRSTEAVDWSSISGLHTTVPQYLAQTPENLRNPTVFRFVSPNPTTTESKQAGAGSIPESSIILQKWEGMVLERGETQFSSHLFEGDEDFPLKRADIDLEELAIEDRELVEPGALFIWTIGYRVRNGGTRSRFSEIYFRRLPQWTKEEIYSAMTRGAALSEEAGWSESK
jgi:hypothetical protein